MQTVATVCVHHNLYALSPPRRLIFLLTDCLEKKKSPPPPPSKEKREWGGGGGGGGGVGGLSKTICPQGGAARSPTRSGFWNLWFRHTGLDRSLPHFLPPLPGPMHCSSLMHAVVPMMHFSPRDFPRPSLNHPSIIPPKEIH